MSRLVLVHPGDILKPQDILRLYFMSHLVLGHPKVHLNTSGCLKTIQPIKKHSSQSYSVLGCTKNVCKSPKYS